jgi:hypothetical protein
VTKRAKKLIEKTRVIPYTCGELQELVKILKGYWESDSIDSDLYFNIEECAESGFHIDRPQGDGSSDYKELNMLQYLMVYHSKIFLFLTCVGQEHVPLYLNRDPLKPFAEWRLQIAK